MVEPAAFAPQALPEDSAISAERDGTSKAIASTCAESSVVPA
jgi:hypothetical protein